MEYSLQLIILEGGQKLLRIEKGQHFAFAVSIRWWRIY